MRVVQTTRRIVETGPDVIDPKAIPMGAIGTVQGDIAPGRSVWVNFGRTLGTLPVPESALVDLPSESDKLVEYLKGDPNAILPKGTS
jgi:hypothetical protein